MNRRVATKAYSIAQFDVTAKHRAIRENHVVADNAIVRDMGTDHKQAIVADLRIAASVHRAVNCRVLANHIAYANDHTTQLLGRIRMLRQAAEDCPFADGCISSELGP